MTFSELLAEAIATTERLATRSDSRELARVAELARSYQGAERVRAPSACPLGTSSRLGFGDVAATTDSEPLVEAYRSNIDQLTWFQNPTVTSDSTKGRAAAELIGPDGAIPSTDLRFGLFVIAAHTHYARHWHGAEEHYMVLAGSAEWDLDDGWRHHGPGQVIQVPSLTPHAIRTASTAVLLLYSWTGDVSFDTYGC